MAHERDPLAGAPDVWRRIVQQAVERERRDEPREVRELRRLAPSSPVLRYFSTRRSRSS